MTPPPEQNGAPLESRSSVKISRNAKGDSQWEIKVVDGSTQDEVDVLRSIAVTQYFALLRELTAGEAPAAGGQPS